MDRDHRHGHRGRLRERFNKVGRESLADYEMLELLLTYPIPRKDTGTTIKHFTGKMLAHYPVPIAPIEEQKSILQKLHESFESLKNTQEQISISLEKVNAMDQSILAKAFRGELVPQDPNDEPASQLLKRIKQEKASLESGKKNGARRGRAEKRL